MLQAAAAAAVDQAKAETFIDDEYKGLQDTKMLLQEQIGNGVDSVPHITLEGKRRDLTLVGAKDVDEYLKAMEQLVKETK